MLHTDFYVSFFNAVSGIVTRVARMTQSGIDSSAVDFGEEEWRVLGKCGPLQLPFERN